MNSVAQIEVNTSGKTKKATPTSPGRNGKELSTQEAPLIEAMRFVLANRKDATFQHKELRKWLAESRDKFMARLFQLEAAEELKRPVSIPDKPDEVAEIRDEGIERCLQVAEEWLRDA